MRLSKSGIRNNSMRAGFAAATALTALVVFGAGVQPQSRC